MKTLTAMAVVAILQVTFAFAQEAEPAAIEVSAVAICRGPSDVVGTATVGVEFSPRQEQLFRITVACAGRAACDREGNCRVASATRVLEELAEVDSWTADVTVGTPDGLTHTCRAAGTSLPADVTCEGKETRYSVLLKIE